MLCKIELATAMPRAGGVYYFLDRSLGPLAGTIGGLGTWFVLVLKTSFALVGMGAYLRLFYPDADYRPIAVAFALFFGAVNVFGAKSTARFQVVMVFSLLAILLAFVGFGSTAVEPVRFEGFFDAGSSAFLHTTALVYVSYVGLTKVASVAEEIEDPERNLPRAVLLALITAVLIYTLGTAVIVGVVPPEELHGSLVPAALAADRLVGPWGRTAITIAAVLAFVSVANAGILSASRYPLAMSRDHILPPFLGRLTTLQTPLWSVATTVGLIVLCLVLFDPTKIAKLAGTFQLFLFAGLCLALIVMRESRLHSYDPGYRVPLYPWTPILGMLASFWLIAQMGFLPLVFSSLVVGGAVAWYRHYARDRISREGVLQGFFARVEERRFGEADRELRGILREKGLREEDPFDAVVAHAGVIDFEEPTGEAPPFPVVAREAALLLTGRVGRDAADLEREFLEGTTIGATPVAHGAALPHVRVRGIEHPEMVIVRSRSGVRIDFESAELVGHSPDNPIHALFFLASPENEPGQHLRMLAQLAEHVDDEEFIPTWLGARDDHDLKEILLREERFLSVRVRLDSRTGSLIGKRVRELDLPEGCLIAMIHRDGESLVPRGDTTLERRDRLTFIGDPPGIRKIFLRYVFED